MHVRVGIAAVAAVFAAILVQVPGAPPAALAVPANDNLANAIAIATPAVSGIVASGSNVGATTEGGENTNPCVSTGKTVWYTWTSPGTPGTVVFDTWGGTVGAQNDTVLAIYTGSAYPLSLVGGGCNDDAFGPIRPSAVALTYAASTTYRIQIGSYGGGAEGEVVLSLALGAAIYVNSTGDAGTPTDASLTLREAIQLATGALTYATLDPTSQGQVKNYPEVGASGSDIIHFMPNIFPPDTPASINIGSTLPTLSSGGDVISGIGSGVIIDGTAATFCLTAGGNANHIEGLRIQDCGDTALWVIGSGNSVGGALSVQRNLIFTSMRGIWVGDPYFPGSTSNTVIMGNYIGTDGVSDLGMIVSGITASGVGIIVTATGTTIGGALPGEGNLISGNGGPGVLISSSSNTQVYGNKIGTDASGANPVPNAIGVWVGSVGILGPSNNTLIGSTAGPGYGNTIAFSDGGTSGFGVLAVDSNARIQGNSIHSNSTSAIDNGYPPFPTVPIISSVAGGIVSGFACAGCTVDVYNDLADEGRVYLGDTTADGSGAFSLSGVAHALPNITATSTNLSGFTSEFSSPFAAAPNQDGDGLPDASDGCPFVAEDYDGFEDGDGCPDEDNDLDGISDAADGGYYLWKNPLGAPVDCKNVAEDFDSFHDGDGCPEPDNDYDTFPDGTDDCPGTDANVGADGIADTGDEPVFYLTPYRAREDFDGVLDNDGCHDSPEDDYDLDSFGILDGGGLPMFRDEREALFLGTDPVRACAATPAADDEAGPDAWPFDFNDDQLAGLSDVLKFIPVFGAFSPSAQYNPRFDFNASGGITLGDVLLFIRVFNQSCAP